MPNNVTITWKPKQSKPMSSQRVLVVHENAFGDRDAFVGFYQKGRDCGFAVYAGRGCVAPFVAWSDVVKWCCVSDVTREEGE